MANQRPIFIKMRRITAPKSGREGHSVQGLSVAYFNLTNLHIGPHSLATRGRSTAALEGHFGRLALNNASHATTSQLRRHKKGRIASAMRIAITSDHAAFDLKAELRDYLIGLGHDVVDLGPETADRVDYPDYGYKLASVVADGATQFGVALCGSGIGISISVNRHPALRCALVSEPLSAALAREHNDANCIAMGARLIGVDMAKACLVAFLSTEFGGGRHTARVEKLNAPSF
jgi:ribose 5-phosphate isomerase B